MPKQNKAIPMSDKLHPIGTLIYTDFTIPAGSTNWIPHRAVWRVIAHRECQAHPNSPTKLGCELELDHIEPLNEVVDD